MKQTRLLEIIREEIASALTEITVVDKKTDSTEAPEIAKKEEKDLSTVQNAIKTAKTTGKPISIAEEEKRKKLAEKYQLDEETINEMASIKQTIDGLKALGDERNEIVAKVAQDTLNQFKKNPAIASDG
jgi:transposase